MPWPSARAQSRFAGLRTGLALLAGLLLGAAAGAQGIESIVAPGKLAQAHVKWEDDCSQCHVKFNRKAQDGLCMDCHKEVGADVRAHTGFHGKGKEQSCRACHTEQRDGARGRGDDLGSTGQVGASGAGHGARMAPPFHRRHDDRRDRR